MKLARGTLFGLAVGVLVAVVLEVLSWTAGRYLQTKGIFYEAEPADVRAYLARRDPLLGWPAREEFGAGDYDRIGARFSPAFPDPQQAALVSLYGDSFTWSSEVGPEDAWGNVLAQLLGGRVNNFGVRGYGSDQAYLRFRANALDDAPIVVLGHLSENILRNVNQHRGLLYAGSSLGFKPRFILDKRGRLELVPLPDLPAEDLAACADAPDSCLEHDYFVSSKTELQFPFSWSVVRSLRHFHMRAAIRGTPWYLEFYDTNHPARGLQITTRILRRFALDAESRDKTPLVLLIPTQDDLMYFRTNGRWPYAPLVQRLSAAGVRLLDAGPQLHARAPGRDARGLYNQGRHFTDTGYRLLAGIVFEYLLRERLASPAPPVDPV